MRTAGPRPLTPGGLPDGNFVIDGLVFPDRTPSPGLLEYKKVSEPAWITVDPHARTIGVRNLHHTRDTGYLRWGWRLEEDGTVGAGRARDRVGAGAHATRRPNVPLGRL